MVLFSVHGVAPHANYNRTRDLPGLEGNPTKENAGNECMGAVGLCVKLVRFRMSFNILVRF